jgi:uncharacterized membrane protein
VSTKVEKTIEVAVPVSTAYNQWTQFEDFPKFMGGVQEVRQLTDRTLHWIAKIGGVKREWDAAILEQTPDQKIAWAATTGATNAGAVYFQNLGPDRTAVRLSLEYEPEGLVEKVGDFLNIVDKQAEKDLEKFKEFVESQGTETGAWRGAVNEPGSARTPGVEDASMSRGDSGKTDA